MADDGRADCDHDRRFRALVLLATFASLRWGEVTALRRCDLDLDAGKVRVRAAFVEQLGALAFSGAMGGPLRLSNFNKMSGWPYAARSIGAEELHVHDLRHTGNTFRRNRRGGDQGSDGADGPSADSPGSADRRGA